MQGEVEIKRSCPFCGTRPEDHDELVPMLNVSEVRSGELLAVTCGNCGAMGPPAETVEEAIELWNRRS